MKSVQLHPGVHCRFIQDDRFKKLQIKVFMQMPLTSTAATAAYLLARYLQRGTERYPEPRQLRMALEHAYGANTSISSMTLGQRSGLVAGLSCLADKFVPGNESVVLEAAEILWEQLFRPRRENGAFAAGQFAESKSAHRAQLEQLIDDKASYAALQCAQRMARPGETFAIHPMGALAELEQLTPETLWPIYQSFLRSGQIDVFVFGDITEHQALAVARRLLEGIERQEPVTLFQGTAGCPECITCREEEEVLDVEQGRLVLGYRRPLSYTPEALARNALFLNIFGASDQSRLFLQLREAESLCYDVDVDQDVFNGILWVQTGIDFANKQQAVDMIRSILLDLSERGPTAEELETARILSLDAIRSLADVPSALVGMQLRNLTGGAWITVEQLTAAMQAVSADDIRAEAARACCDLIYFLRGEAS